MYTLTLTANERKAIDWVGDRYSHGTDLFHFLCKGEWTPDVDWDSDKDIRISLPEWVAWEIYKIGEDDAFIWTCFSPEFTQKMTEFCDKII